MLYRKMPKTGDMLSILGFGCMRFAVDNNYKVDEERTITQIRDSIEKGVNYFDTAWPYHGGESERILGHALKDGYRERVRIADKLPSWMIKSREDMDRFLNAQLERLGVDYIDYYLLHALEGRSFKKLKNLGVKEFLDSALADGRIKNTGFSFHGILSDFKDIIDFYPWEMCQIQYNILDQEFQAGTEGLKYAADKDIGVVIMEPLRGGNLGLPEAPPSIKEIWDRADVKRTPAEWALKWLWNKPEITVVLSGMNYESHIEENLRIAGESEPGCLTEEECALVDEVAEKYKEIMKVGCTGCGYCLPCPEGVGIPLAFDVYNKFHLFGNIEEAKSLYAVRLSGMLVNNESGYASQCISCGECLSKCPQGIEIPDILEKVAEEMEDEHMEKRVAMVKKVIQRELKPK